jgi:hypothetical protein
LAYAGGDVFFLNESPGAGILKEEGVLSSLFFLTFVKPQYFYSRAFSRKMMRIKN